MLAIIAISFVGFGLLVPVLFTLFRLLGLYIVVPERRAFVYTLFGDVVGIYDEAGLRSLWTQMGVKALLVTWLGKRYEVDLRLDQNYLRSQPVNSEEGAPMGIGVWYEMFITDPKAFLFQNQDPRGSLRANVSNATVRGLSNMELERLLEERHSLSEMVRGEVSPTSAAWGYAVGTVYIRKVHFRDEGMIRGIEEKVVNRLRQVTSAIKQDGANQVSIITSSADRIAAIEFARAAATRPEIVGKALNEIGRDPEVAAAMFDMLEVQRLIDGPAKITLVPPGGSTLVAQLAARS